MPIKVKGKEEKEGKQKGAPWKEKEKNVPRQLKCMRPRALAGRLPAMGLWLFSETFPIYSGVSCPRLTRSLESEAFSPWIFFLILQVSE